MHADWKRLISAKSQSFIENLFTHPKSARMSARLLHIFVFLAMLLAGQTAAFASKPAPAYPAATPEAETQYAAFPKPTATYNDADKPMAEKIQSRAQSTPFNLIVTILFACAILHTFLAPAISAWARRVEHAHHEEQAAKRAQTGEKHRDEVSFKATMLEFLGEVEVVFALWAVPVFAVAIYYYSWQDMISFVNLDSTFVEPMFVFVIMAIAASRPVVKFAEHALSFLAAAGKGTPTAWWLAILIVGPLMGSLITEPAAMTISALILSRKIYELKPGKTFKYATLGLLFVNVSVGGVLTNFAAPPVLMVAGPDRWNWSSLFMLKTFGSHAVMAILINTTIYFLIFRKQLADMNVKALAEKEKEKHSKAEMGWVDNDVKVPGWITISHLLFLLWTVVTAHYPALFIGGFLFFMGIVQATGHHQSKLNFRGPLMVGFFLAGLVIHGRLQSWWLEPVLSSGLGDWSMHLGAATLTAFNDNALITFLASQVEHLSDGAKYAIMSGAVAGGGLTVIANAPNPAGQALLKRYFPDGISPLGLLLGAIAPTIVVVLVFMLVR